MFRNHIKTTFRSLMKNKGFTFLNIFGLSVGIGAALLLIVYVQFESSYDKFYENGDRLYRVSYRNVINGRERFGITGSGLTGPTMEESFPEIERVGRSHRVGSKLLELDGKKLYERLLRYADPGLMDVLEIDFLEGDPATSLEQRNSLVLTESLAAKIFEPGETIVGRSLKVGEDLMQVTGLIADLPRNSHFRANGFISMASQGTFSWNRVGHVTYVRLTDPSFREQLAPGFKQMLATHVLPILPADSEADMSLYPVPDIHLSGDPNQEGVGNATAVLSFTIIAIFLLTIASINYMNLATARSMKRVKEIGMRKVIGARKSNLITQFLTESVVITVISVLIGGFLAELSSSYFNQLIGTEIEIGLLSNVKMLGLMLFAGVILGLISGLYPASYISSFQPADAFHGGKSPGKGNRNMRRVLVGIQFVISVSMIISTLIIYRQLHYLQNKDLGYNQESVMAIILPKADTTGILKQKLLQLPDVEAISATNLMPATGDSGATFEIEDDLGQRHRDIVSMASIDYDYLDMMQMTLVEGRNFSKDLATDENSIIINETLARKYGWENPIGKKIAMNNQRRNDSWTVIGVVEDFNMLSLYESVKPFAFFLKPEFDWGRQYLLTRIRPENLDATVANVKSAYEEIEKDYPFNNWFLEEYFELIYQEEAKRGEMYLSFSLLTIVIACVGLFGLAAFILQQRVKEISIRKVLGANIQNIIGLVSKEYMIIILIATVVASPVAYYFTDKWLATFVYHVPASIENFLIGGILALMIAIITISFQSIRTARTNPARNLKHE